MKMDWQFTIHHGKSIDALWEEDCLWLATGKDEMLHIYIISVHSILLFKFDLENGIVIFVIWFENACNRLVMLGATQRDMHRNVVADRNVRFHLHQDRAACVVHVVLRVDSTIRTFINYPPEPILDCFSTCSRRHGVLRQCCSGNATHRA